MIRLSRAPQEISYCWGIKVKNSDYKNDVFLNGIVKTLKAEYVSFSFAEDSYAEIDDFEDARQHAGSDRGQVGKEGVRIKMSKGNKKISIPWDNLDDYNKAIRLGYRTVDNTKIKMSKS